MNERMQRRLAAAIALAKERLIHTHDYYGGYVDVLDRLRISASLPAFGETDMDGQRITIRGRYIRRNSERIIARLLMHEFIHSYQIRANAGFDGHGQNFQRLVNEVYETNGMRVHADYTMPTSDMTRADAYCRRCGQKYHWSQPRIARHRNGAKFYCHDCKAETGKFYWLRLIEEADG